MSVRLDSVARSVDSQQPNNLKKDLKVDHCKHIEEVRQQLQARGIKVWSEHGEDPADWVNVWCPECETTYGTVLK